MGDFFRRQLTDYASYHRDGRNCVTHAIGVPVIFLSIVLPLCLWPVAPFGISANLAIVLVIPALIVWFILDAAIGFGILAAVIPLLAVATAVATYASPFIVWSAAAALFVIGWALQILGHAHFEHRKPALLDNPMHMLIGPMFMVAKLYAALGLRPDLTPAMQPADASVRSEAHRQP